MEELNNILAYSIIEIEDVNITVFNVLLAILCLLGAKMLFLMIAGTLRRIMRNRKKSEKARTQSLLQIIRYFIFFVAFLFALKSLGVNFGIIWASSAALFVGLGFGLQNTFNDFVSGIILLFEGTIEQDDIIEVNGLVGKVNRIGLRTTTIITIDAINIIIPNAKLTGENIVNWSHENEQTRFKIMLGVAYGSDTELVKQTLKEVAQAHPAVLATPEVIVSFSDFGDSALIFELLFWSQEIFDIEIIKGQIRYEIDHAFRSQGIKIPFPQRDLHFISNNPSLSNS